MLNKSVVNVPKPTFIAPPKPISLRKMKAIDPITIKQNVEAGHFDFYVKEGVIYCKNDGKTCMVSRVCDYTSFEDKTVAHQPKLDAHKMIVMRITVNESQIRDMEKQICKTQQSISNIIAMNAFLESLIARPNEDSESER